MNLLSLLKPEAVLPQLAARDKKQVLKLLAAEAAPLTGIAEKELYSALVAREHLGSTAMSGGVAVPHARIAELAAPAALFASLAEPVDFDAPDGKPVDILCVLLTQDGSNTDHLKALALVSRLLRDKELCATLRSMNDAQAMYRLITAERSEG
jgi:PTS system nitrogen regulatory IIA component